MKFCLLNTMNHLAKQLILRQLIRHHPIVGVPVARFNKSSNLSKEPVNTKSQSTDEQNQPIEYFGSNAASWRARQSHGRTSTDEDLWYQPFVISGSLAVFLIYFCILREENDVDQKLSMSLYDRIDGLEEHQLEATLQYNRSNGLPTLDVENRLKELRANKT